MTLPDLPSFGAGVEPIPELAELAALSLEPARIRTHASEPGRRRVFIPDMPVTPVSERRCLSVQCLNASLISSVTHKC